MDWISLVPRNIPFMPDCFYLIIGISFIGFIFMLLYMMFDKIFGEEYEQL